MQGISQQSTCKEHGLLRDEADLRVQVLVVDRIKRRAIQQNLASLRRIEVLQQIDDCALQAQH